MENRVFFRAKKLMERWYLLNTEKFLNGPFRRREIRSFFEPKCWWRDHIYWLLESSCFELFGHGKYGLFWSQKVDEKTIFTDYWKILVWSFSVIGNMVFFSAKKLMERWYLLGLFELSLIFQDLGNMVFRTVIGSAALCLQLFLLVVSSTIIQYFCLFFYCKILLATIFEIW